MKNAFFFFFYGETEKEKPKKKKIIVDYDLIYAKLKEGPLTFRQIEELSGVSHSCVYQVITTLSLNFPIWSPARGVYKLIEESDYE